MRAGRAAAPSTARTLWLLAAATVACLAPVAGKAFSVDDPIFLWVARQIHAHPLDPYGFAVNFTGIEEPMAAIINHPPLAGYYLAAASALVGWSEVALHLAFLLPVVAAVLGTYLLARRLCRQAWLAAALLLLTPALLISGTSVMSDTLLLACWVWSIACWMQGLASVPARPRPLALATLLLSACLLTKYSGLCLIPLLGAYAALRTRRLGWWVTCLIIPVLALLGYQWLMRARYGLDVMQDAAAFAAQARAHYGGTAWSKGLIGLAFTGGCLASVSCCAPVAWPPRALAGGLIASVALLLALACLPSLGGYALRDGQGIRWFVLLQVSLWVVLGFQVIALAVGDLWAGRDGASALLALWVLGVLAFACCVNPVINGRSLLPMAPAAAVLVVRRLERRRPASAATGLGRLAWPLAPAAALALMVVWADVAWANSGRAAARAIAGKHPAASTRLRFLGHWGFQYYMEAGGFRPFDIREALPPGELLAIPINNTGLELATPLEDLQLVERLQWPLPGRVSTMSFTAGAGFHADVWGPLPFVFGLPPAEDYVIMARRAEGAPE